MFIGQIISSLLVLQYSTGPSLSRLSQVLQIYILLNKNTPYGSEVPGVRVNSWSPTHQPHSLPLGEHMSDIGYEKSVPHITHLFEYIHYFPKWPTHGWCEGLNSLVIWHKYIDPAPQVLIIRNAPTFSICWFLDCWWLRTCTSWLLLGFIFMHHLRHQESNMFNCSWQLAIFEAIKTTSSTYSRSNNIFVLYDIGTPIFALFISVARSLIKSANKVGDSVTLSYACY